MFRWIALQTLRDPWSLAAPAVFFLVCCWFLVQPSLPGDKGLGWALTDWASWWALVWGWVHLFKATWSKAPCVLAVQRVPLHAFLWAEALTLNYALWAAAGLSLAFAVNPGAFHVEHVSKVVIHALYWGSIGLLIGECLTLRATGFAKGCLPVAFLMAEAMPLGGLLYVALILIGASCLIREWLLDGRSGS